MRVSVRFPRRLVSPRVGIALAGVACVAAAIVAAIAALPVQPPAQHQLGSPMSAADLAFQSVGISSPDARVSPVRVSSPSPADGASLKRMIIPAISVDAPLAVVGRDAGGVMQMPPDPKTVAWYGFTARPGSGSNAVFAGHLDYVHYGPAVFWNLHKLRYGDQIEITLADGTVYRYRVVSSEAYDIFHAPVADIIGPTTYDAITLITCTGSYNWSLHLYEERLIVRAQRVS